MPVALLDLVFDESYKIWKVLLVRNVNGIWGFPTVKPHLHEDARNALRRQCLKLPGASGILCSYAPLHTLLLRRHHNQDQLVHLLVYRGQILFQEAPYGQYQITDGKDCAWFNCAELAGLRCSYAVQLLFPYHRWKGET